MCGIIGRVGSGDALKVVLKGLERLQYRGYDSAGIAIYNGNDLRICKTVGTISNLIGKAQSEELKGHLCIGHTRWATHGKASEANAHPHQSKSGLFTVVHNGIIENASEEFHKAFNNKNILNSQTDTEIIAHLLEKNYNGDALQTIALTLKKLKGSYALGIICREFPNTLFGAASESPLVVAKGENCNYISSDTLALKGLAKDYISVENGEIAQITENEITIFDNKLNRVNKLIKELESDAADGDMQGFEHYMMLEIMQQPDAVRNSLDSLFKKDSFDFVDMLPMKFIKNHLKSVYFVGCGSAYNVALVGKNAVEGLTDIKAQAVIASEFRYSNIKLDGSSLVILISQSGETADTLAALRFAKQKGAKTLSVVNVKGSVIANESDFVIYTKSGREVSVATTKAYSAQLAVCYAFALYLAKNCGVNIENYLDELRTIHTQIADTIKSAEEECKRIAVSLSKSEDMYFIGRQNCFAAALEGSLKMKEITYIHAECYPAGELKHGAISLISEDTPVIAIATQKELFSKTLSNISEVKARGAYTVLITDNNEYAKDDIIDEIILIPKTNTLFTPSLSVPVLQLLSYYTALNLGRDIDKPKNLAKSVTVE